MNILIVGNIIKDTYLEFSENLFEVGNSGQIFLDTEFDEETLYYKNKESILSGASIIDEVLRNFRLNSYIGNIQDSNSHKHDSRYVLKTRNSVKYLTANSCGKTEFTIPESALDWIFIDRSARLDLSGLEKIEQYLKQHQDTKLVIHMNQKSFGFLYRNDDVLAQEVGRRLVSRAEFIFITGEDEIINTKENWLNISKQIRKPGRIFRITPESVTTDDYKVFFTHNKKYFQTHLAIYSITASTIFAALASGWNLDRALKLAKINIENAKINKTLNINKLYSRLKKLLQKEDNLQLIAHSLTADQKGILAIDESKKSIRRKLRKYNLPETRTIQEKYREFLITTPEISDFLNGMILSQETAIQELSNKQSVPDFLTMQRILPGVKVDLGLEKIPNHTNYRTCGLDDLDIRLSKYYNLGFRFTKWRAVFEPEETQKIPEAIIDQNTSDLARYAKKAIDKDLVPIIEPEVLIGPQDITTYYKNTEAVLRALIEKLADFGVPLNFCILKINMIYSKQNQPDETGRMTMKLISETIPKNIGGIVFLSGGQDDEQSTENLKAIIRENNGKYRISFSFGRAIQDSALKVWRADNKNLEVAQKKLIERLKKNCKALQIN